MAKQKLFKFNVKNLKFSIPVADVYPAPADIAYAHSLSLEADFSETELRGDGEVLGILGDDKGKTGAFAVINIEEAYEIACGRSLAITGGLGDVQQRKSVEHAIYYETEAYEDGKTITIKCWMFGCFTGKPNEAYEQTGDDPVINTYEYSLKVLGTNLRNAADDADAIDLEGNTTKVFRITAFPDDTGYATFGDSVPAAKELV